MAKQKLFLAFVISGGLTVSALVGCDIDDKCGSNLVYRDRACMPPLAPDAAVAPDTATVVAAVDAAATPADSEGIAAPDTAGPPPVDTASAGTAFGATCKVNTDCTGTTTYCAIQPGAPTGYCTAIGCDKTPSLCPTGYTCIQMFTSPYFCMKS